VENDFKRLEVKTDILMQALRSFLTRRHVLDHRVSLDEEELRKTFAAEQSATVSIFQFANFVQSHNSLIFALRVFLVSRLDLHKLLTPISMEWDLKQLRDGYLTNTRGWVFEHLEVWARLPSKDPRHRIFWLKADAGMGKTIIAGEIVARYEALKKSPLSKLVAYFFCKHYDEARNEVRSYFYSGV